MDSVSDGKYTGSHMSARIVQSYIWVIVLICGICASACAQLGATDVLEANPEPIGTVLENIPADLSQTDNLQTESLLTDSSCLAQTIPYSTGSLFGQGSWYTQQEIVMLTHTDVTDRLLVVNDLGIRVNMGSLPFRFQPGTRLTLGRLLDENLERKRFAAEFTWFGLFDWRQSQTLRGTATPNGLVTTGSINPLELSLGPSSIPIFTTADEAEVAYSSELNSYELNIQLRGRTSRDRAALQPDGQWIRHATASRVKTLMAGLRVLSVDEEYFHRMLERRADGGRDTGIYRARLDNDLVGLQLGTEQMHRRNHWRWGIRLKAGGLVNFGDRQTTFDTDVNNQLQSIREHLSDERLAFLGEAGVFFGAEIRQNLIVRTGYDALYLTGLGVVPTNISLQDSPLPLNLSGDAVYHGLTFGFEYVW